MPRRVNPSAQGRVSGIDSTRAASIRLHQPRRALAFWTRLHGVLSLKLAGHLTVMGIDPAQLFAAEVDGLLAD